MLFYGLINIDFEPEKVYNIIKKYLYNDSYDNYNIPQYKFITDKDDNLIKNITIFRTQTLTQDLKKYGFTDYNGQVHANIYEKYLNDESIDLINKFYKKDFTLFNYKIKSV